jgi:signal transduction histidine kinase
MRSLLLELRPEALTRAPLHDLLRTLATATASKTGVEVDARLDPVPVLPPDVQLAFYRIAQEALTNITKHAAATRIEIGLHASEGAAEGTTELALEIADDGGGFDPAEPSPGRLGLVSMRERADGIGASFLVVSRPGEGTIVTVRWTGVLSGRADEPTKRAGAPDAPVGSLPASVA